MDQDGMRAFVLSGKAEALLAGLEDCSVDAVVTDPPYELTSGKKGGTGEASLNVNSPAGRSRIGTGGGFMGKEWDATGVPMDPAFWAQVLRVLKPGGHVAAFGGSRTHHRLACAVEDAGFEIRDSLHWIYGSGFPKSLDVGKAIDKAAGAKREVVGKGINYDAKVKHGGTWTGGVYAQDDYTGADGPLVTAPATEDAARWDGWGTALKPAHEPIVLARKPLVGTVAGNVLEYGTGALNLAACTVGTKIMTESRMSQSPGGVLNMNGRDVEHGNWQQKPNDDPAERMGRWAPNLLLTHAVECRAPGWTRTDAEDGALFAVPQVVTAWTCVAGCPVAGLDAQSGVRTSGSRKAGTYGLMGYMGADAAPMPEVNGDTGGASRFFPQFAWDPEYDLPFLYQAKAPKSERPRAAGVKGHPTVKPLALMRWLCRLLCPPGGLILDPFGGTMTTVQAALLEGFRCVSADDWPDAIAHARVRLARYGEMVTFGSLPVAPRAGNWPRPGGLSFPC